MREIPVISIDSGVPVPEGAGQRFPVDKLEVGESILFPLVKRKSVSSIANRLKRQTGKKFTVKKMDDKHARIWRVE